MQFQSNRTKGGSFLSGYSEYTQSALNILRDPTQTMHWYIIPLLLIVMYIVTKELSEKHYHVVLAGFALWGVDIFNEIWNSMICFISGYAPVWGTPVGVGNTAWLLMIGYNIEISFMFLIMGITCCLMLPKDPKAKILGINNRHLGMVFLAAQIPMDPLAHRLPSVLRHGILCPRSPHREAGGSGHRRDSGIRCDPHYHLRLPRLDLRRFDLWLQFPAAPWPF